jgi:hypothetical protein
MDDTETIAGFVVVALLSSYLYFKHRKRIYGVPESRELREWMGRPIDAIPLKNRLDRVRRDYVAARGIPKGVCFHRSLLGFVRAAVAQLAYFRDKPQSRL